jgi:hypothetical protein
MRLPQGGEPIGIGAFARIGPGMTDDQAGGVTARCTGGQQRTSSADRRIALVVGIAGAVGGGIGKQLTLRAAVTVHGGFVVELAARYHAGARRGWAASALNIEVGSSGGRPLSGQ